MRVVRSSVCELARLVMRRRRRQANLRRRQLRISWRRRRTVPRREDKLYIRFDVDIR